MNKTEQHYLDKTHWPEGPWKSEPDRVSWVDLNTGYTCLVRRNDKMGFLCGYVAIEKTHPLYEKEYTEADLYCHGGLTFSRHCDGDTEKGICHLTEHKDDVWWFGFDCAHADDLFLCSQPSSLPNSILEAQDSIMMQFKQYMFLPTYRDLAYVTSEVESLAKQLKDMKIKDE